MVKKTPSRIQIPVMMPVTLLLNVLGIEVASKGKNTQRRV
jgi:hypothetical protein